MKKTNNKLLALFIALLALVALCIVSASAEAEIVDQGNCGAQGDNVTYTIYLDRTGVISGTGAMADYEMGDRPWDHFSSEVSAMFNNGTLPYLDIVLEEGITSIGKNAFAYTPFRNVVLPSSLKSIGENAFRGCTALESITLPEGLQSIGPFSFEGCSSLESITIPAGLSSSKGAFMTYDQSEYGLKNVTLEDGLLLVDSAMFALTKIEEIEIPNSVKKIGALAFVCPNLKSIHLGTNIESIGMGAFNTEIVGVANHVFTIYTCMTEEEFQNITFGVWTEEDQRLIGQPPELYASIPDTATIVYNAHTLGDPVEETIPATETTLAHIDSVTYCTLCGKEISREVIEVIPGHNHTFAANWTWSDDGTMATAIVACSGCDFSTTILCTNIIREPQNDGSIKCTATVTYDNVPYTDTKIVQPATGGGNGGGSGGGNGGSGGSGGSGGVTIKSRCQMCDFYEEYKKVPFAGWIISIVHFFVHMASRI